MQGTHDDEAARRLGPASAFVGKTVFGYAPRRSILTHSTHLPPAQLGSGDGVSSFPPNDGLRHEACIEGGDHRGIPSLQADVTHGALGNPSIQDGTRLMDHGEGQATGAQISAVEGQPVAIGLDRVAVASQRSLVDVEPGFTSCPIEQQFVPPDCGNGALDPAGAVLESILRTGRAPIVIQY